MKLSPPFGSGSLMTSDQILQVVGSALSDTSTNSDWYKTGSGDLYCHRGVETLFTIILMNNDEFLLALYENENEYRPYDCDRGHEPIEGEAGGDPFYSPASVVAGSIETLEVVKTFVEKGIESVLSGHKVLNVNDIEQSYVFSFN